MRVVRLQTVVSREVAPGDTAVLTVGSLQAGTRSNVIPDHAVQELNMRSYSQPTLAEIPAPAAAHLADRHRGPDHSRPGLARVPLGIRGGGGRHPGCRP
jgi:hypothetical protein